MPTIHHSQPLAPFESMLHIHAYSNVVHGRNTKPSAGTIQPENASPICRPKIQKPMIHKRGKKATPTRTVHRMNVPNPGPDGVLCWGSGLMVWVMATGMLAARA